MINILHSADFHLGARFHSLPPEKAQARRQEQLGQRRQNVPSLLYFFLDTKLAPHSPHLILPENT